MPNLKEIQEFLENLAGKDLYKVKFKTDEIEMTVQLKPDIKVAAYQAPVHTEINHAPQTSPERPANIEIKKDDIEEDSNLLTIKSPIVGTFYRKPAPDKPDFVEIGQTIKVGDIVCIVEAMKLFNDIESDVSGEIVKVLVEDGSPIEFDQPLFLVKPV